MKKIGLFLLLAAFVLFQACTDEPQDPDSPDSPDGPVDLEDIQVSAEILPGGGELELSDESGNLLRVVFPPLALEDTVSVTLTLKGNVEEQPLEMRHIRSFEILPEDLRLYEALQISLFFKEKQENMELSGLFRVPSQGRLQALGEYDWSASGDTLKTRSVRAGSFTEGIISPDEILRQVDQIYAAYISNAKGSYSVLDASDDIADAWANLNADIQSIVGFHNLLEENDFYNDNPDHSLQEDAREMCEKLVCKGVGIILKMPVPEEDPCNRDYMQTIGDMESVMNTLGCEQCDAFAKVRERFTQLIRDCGSFLDTDLYFKVNSAGGTLSQHDQGAIPISARFDEYGVVVVEGSSELKILGEMSVKDCTGNIVGTSTVFVYGFRDAAYNYTLNLLAEDEGSYIITCPNGSYTQAFTSTPIELEVELNPGNEFTWDKDYPIEEGGNMHVYIKLHNPWAGVPD